MILNNAELWLGFSLLPLPDTLTGRQTLFLMMLSTFLTVTVPFALCPFARAIRIDFIQGNTD